LVVWVFWWRARAWWSGCSGGGHTRGGQDVLMVGACSKGLTPSPFRCPSGAHLIASPKFSKMSQWAWKGRGCLSGLTFLPQRQVLAFKT